jgi:hypothetical protein
LNQQNLAQVIGYIFSGTSGKNINLTNHNSMITTRKI